MPVLKDYTQFNGLHWETGTVRNVLDYQGVIAPHTGQPFSEALLMGVSGGAAFGYFLFDYEGYDPILALLTRNTFDPLETMLERMVIPHELIHAVKPESGHQNLLEVLEGGRPAIVFADMFSLPYNALPYDAGVWGVMPIVVYGVDDTTVYIADRSRQPLTVPLEAFNQARSRIKKFRYRILTLDAPDMSKLPAAVQKGIWQSISLYTEKPPKGAKHNFGFAAYQQWADRLTNTRNKQSWARFFPPGKRLYAALTRAYETIIGWSGERAADRPRYADFLDEAAQILSKPALKTAAEGFRASGKAWCKLADALLPHDVALLKETRDLLQHKNSLFFHQGGAVLDEIRQVNARLKAIRAAVDAEFPMSEGEITAMRERLREHVLTIHDIEREAVDTMQAAMA